MKLEKKYMYWGLYLLLGIIAYYLIYKNWDSISSMWNGNAEKKINCTSNSDCKKPNTHCGSNGICEYNELNRNFTPVIINTGRPVPEKVPTKRG